MKLSAWAKENGVSYRAALNWFHAGTLPVPARQLATGTILVDPPVRETGVTVAYCRVSSDPKVSTIVVEHRDRLARFGVEYLEAALAAHGRRVVVLDDAELPPPATTCRGTAS